MENWYSHLKHYVLRKHAKFVATFEAVLAILQAQLPPLQAIWEAILGGRLPHLKQFWGVRLRDWKQFRYRPGAFGANIGSWLPPLQAIWEAISGGRMPHLKQFLGGPGLAI